MVINKDILNRVVGYSYSICRKNAKASVCPDDLAQETLRQLYKYEGAVEHLSSFLYTAVRNNFLNSIRINKKHKRNIQSVFEYYAYAHYSETPVKLDADKLLAVFNKMPKRKKVLQLILDNPESSLVDLAKASGINSDTLKANVIHIRNTLKALGLTSHNFTSNF